MTNLIPTLLTVLVLIPQLSAYNIIWLNLHFEQTNVNESEVVFYKAKGEYFLFTPDHPTFALVDAKLTENLPELDSNAEIQPYSPEHLISEQTAVFIGDQLPDELQKLDFEGGSGNLTKISSQGATAETYRNTLLMKTVPAGNGGSGTNFKQFGIINSDFTNSNQPEIFVLRRTEIENEQNLISLSHNFGGFLIMFNESQGANILI